MASSARARARRRPPFSLYLITDRTVMRGGIVADVERALAAIEAVGVKAAIQLREKDLAGRELYELARELRVVCGRYQAALLVNDRIDVALAAKADGVHLPSDSFAARDVCELLGVDQWIGVSAHSPGELRRAEQEGADFAVYGPVFDPISKGAYDPAIGMSGLTEGCRATALPVFALGGITADRIPELLASGAAGVALIGSIFGAGDPAGAARSIAYALKDWSRQITSG